MANTYLTPTQVTRKALMILHQKLNFVGSITREYDDSFAKEGAKIGDSLKIRLPNQYSVTTGATLSTQNTAETSTTLQISTQKHVGMNFTTADLTLQLDDFSERIIEPAMNVLAASIEADALSMYKDVYQQVNNQGAAATLGKLLLGRKALVDSLSPPGWAVQLNTQDNVDLIDSLKALFQKDSTIAKQNTEGELGRWSAFNFFENTLNPAHTRGAANTAYTTDISTATLATDGTAYATITVATGASAMKKGDVFVIAGLFRVHPESKAVTQVQHQFVVTADYAGGGGAVSISPSIVLGGAKQNCSVVTSSTTAAISFAGTASTAHGISLAYQKGAFAFATADLVMPKGVDFGYRDVLDGISMRIVRQYDINNDALPCRVDVLYGYKTIRPQLAVRLANN